TPHTPTLSLHDALPISIGKQEAALLGPGACFLDYDADGKLDLLLGDDGKEGGLGLYHNLGNGKFEDATKPAGLDPALHATGCTRSEEHTSELQSRGHLV